MPPDPTQQRAPSSGPNPKDEHLKRIGKSVRRYSTSAGLVWNYSGMMPGAAVACAAVGEDNTHRYVIMFAAQAAAWSWHGYALRKEELFRRLYEHMQSLAERDIDFGMDTSPFVADTSSWVDMCLSKRTGVLHGLCLAVITVSTLVGFTRPTGTSSPMPGTRRATPFPCRAARSDTTPCERPPRIAPPGAGRSPPLQFPPMVETLRPLSPRAAAQYRQRWALAHKRLIEELRATPMETKLDRLATLMESAREMGWSQSLGAEDETVRARWMALRRAKLGEA